MQGHPLELPVKLACHLGLRRSEVLGLRWRDVDLQGSLISVRRVRTTVGCRVVEKPPKTPDSCRTLSIGVLDGLLELLRDLQAVRLRDDVPCSPDDYLVLDWEGKPWHPNVMSTTLNSFVSARCLPPITFHGLRHPNVKPKTQILRSFFEDHFAMKAACHYSIQKSIIFQTIST